MVSETTSKKSDCSETDGNYQSKVARKVAVQKIETEYEFIPPKFDERRFLKNQIASTGYTVVSIIIGIPCGIICAVIQILIGGNAGLLFGIVALIFFTLKHSKIIGIFRISEDKMVMRYTDGKSFVYIIKFYFIMVAIAFWIMMINDPFIGIFK